MSEKKVIMVSLVLVVDLILLVFWSFDFTRKHQGTVVLPGGVTYLGPTQAQVKWITHQGNLFPYSFSYPENYKLGFFPGDPFEPIAILSQNTPFFRVEDLNRLHKKTYLTKPKIEYARVWWKDYSAWRGVKEIVEFTNSQGLKGYRASYLDGAGKTPFEHVFLEVPSRPELVIWLSGESFTQVIFDRLVDSFVWN